MLRTTRRISLVICVILSMLFASSCKTKKEGKIIVTDQEYSLRHDGKNSWSLDVRGEIQNTGAVDCKNIVVTGYCRSCGEIVHQGKWFINDLEKTPIQMDTVAYLAEGDKEDFSFKEVAYYWAKGGKKPAEIPEEIEVVIDSFETE